MYNIERITIAIKPQQAFGLAYICAIHPYTMFGESRNLVLPTATTAPRLLAQILENSFRQKIQNHFFVETISISP